MNLLAVNFHPPPVSNFSLFSYNLCRQNIFAYKENVVGSTQQLQRTLILIQRGLMRRRAWVSPHHCIRVLSLEQIKYIARILLPPRGSSHTHTKLVKSLTRLQTWNMRVVRTYECICLYLLVHKSVQICGMFAINIRIHIRSPAPSKNMR